MSELPAGEAREDERELEKVADRVQNAEQGPARVVEPSVLPATALNDRGDTVGIVGPDGHPVGIRGQIVSDLSAIEARHEAMRRVKPCISCRFAWFPKEGSDEWADREAHVSQGRFVRIIPPLQSAQEFLACPMRKNDFPERPDIMWMHASQTCAHLPNSHHSFRRDWLKRLKRWIRIRTLGGRA